MAKNYQKNATNYSKL